MRRQTPDSGVRSRVPHNAKRAPGPSRRRIMSTATTATNPEVTIGIDLGDRKSHICVLDSSGEVLEEGTVATTEAGLRKPFEL